MRCLTLANEKGGVAKTTTALALAPLFAADGMKVLVVDLDPQANCTRTLTEKLRHELEATGIYELVQRHMKNMVRKNTTESPRDCVIQTRIPNVDIIPANAQTAQLDMYCQELGKNFGLSAYVFVADAVAGVADDYDLIICDTAPQKSVLTLSGIYMGTHILIPYKADLYAVEGVKNTFGLMEQFKRENPDYQGKVLGIVNICRERTALNTILRENMEASFGEYLLQTEIRKAQLINECTATDRTITEYSPSSVVAQDYKALYAEIKARL